MNYTEVKKDDHNFYLLLNGYADQVRLKKYKSENIMIYYLPIEGEKEYNRILKYLANCFNNMHYYPTSNDDLLEDELYCFITDNLNVKYFYQNDMIYVEIKNDNVNEKSYDKILTQMVYELYCNSNKGMSK